MNFSGNPKSILKVLVGKTPGTDFKTLSQECGLQCETNGSYNKYKHWKHDSEASLKPPSRFRVAAVQETGCDWCNGLRKKSRPRFDEKKYDPNQGKSFISF